MCKKNAAIVLTASQPFTSALVMSNIGDFKYEWVWDKKAAANVMNAKKHPLKVHENVIVFSAGTVPYYPLMTKGKLRFKGGADRKEGNIFGATGKENGVKNDEYFPKSIFEFSNAGRSGKLHPTQKPVALMEYLIRTYTNEGETVLDNCMGSGTTGVACAKTGRRFIGIERDETYFNGAKSRIEQAFNELDLFRSV